MKFILCIPTYNPGKFVPQQISAIQKQTVQPTSFLIIDSSSKDGSVEKYRHAGGVVKIISKSEFNHGGTRNIFRDLAAGDIYLYLTQDAIPAEPDTFEILLKNFSDDDKLGAVYGRQIPHKGAGAFGAHSRMFNYPASSSKKNFLEAKRLGIKGPFCSNSFAGYRAEALSAIGGFPKHVIVSEDVFAAAKMLASGWNVKYEAGAPVYHSHDYSVFEEFRRYFDIGVFHAKESWIRNTFGEAEGEGFKFLKSEIKYLMDSSQAIYIPHCLMRNALKLLGYRLGVWENRIPKKLKIRLSMHKGFWETNGN